jgi:MoaA/NifB/PqqE/SkfB family radical SAM enzyme
MPAQNPSLEQDIGFLTNMGLMMTYRCQVACPHCVVEAGPHRTEEVDLAEAKGWVAQMAGYRNGRVQVLSLTGGEPFCAVRKLREISDFAANLGLVVTVATNALWATSSATALRMLRSLRGVCMIGISADPYHQGVIPFDRVVNAIDAAKSRGIPHRVLVATESETDPEYLFFMDRLKRFTSADNIVTVITFYVGRALVKIDANRYQWDLEPNPCACTAVGAPVVFPDGRVIACIGPLLQLHAGHSLALGNLRDEPLADVLDRAENNSVLHAIRVWGPRKLVEILRESPIACQLPHAWVRDSNCDVCYKLFSNPAISAYLERLNDDAGFKRYTAYGRVHYLNDPLTLDPSPACS